MTLHSFLHTPALRCIARSALVALALAVLPAASPATRPPAKKTRARNLRTIQLDAPRLTGPLSLEQAISKRRSIREFIEKPLDYNQLGQLAWAGQGITQKQKGLRAAPSAGATYPITLYFATQDGLFVYQPQGHRLQQLQNTDLRARLAGAAFNQKAVANAGCDIIITGSPRKMLTRFGDKSRTFMLLEAGRIAQNIQLQAVALGLGSVTIGGFEAAPILRLLHRGTGYEPVCIIPVGYPLRPAVTPEPNAAQIQPANSLPATKAGLVVLIIPSQNFRDEELFETQRILTDAQITTVIASPTTGPVRGMLGGTVDVHVALSRLKVDEYDAIVFIGGTGTARLFNNPAALAVARRAAVGKKVLAAISTAPAILARAGLLNHLTATAYITERRTLQKAGAKYTGSPVERDGLIITASGPLAVVPFGQAIAAAVLQAETKAQNTTK